MSTVKSSSNLFWLRDEIKPNEKRTAILPEHAKQLIDNGHSVTVEASDTRCVSTEEYQKVGCKIVPSGTWSTHAPSNAIVLGLKELDIDPTKNYDLTHRHVYFAHCYKNQSGWRELLTRFVNGRGTLLDLEFLTHANGARVAAFGRSAGFIGMGVGLLNWVFQQKSTQENMPSLEYYHDFAHMVSVVGDALKPLDRKPRALVIGALGRCGRGAVSLAEAVGIEVAKWDMNETQGGGPFNEILDYDILVNCIYLSQPIPAFVTRDMLDAPRKLTVVVDVSCDYTNPNNPIPIYSQGTDFPNPNLRIISGSNPLDVIAIDHLPSLVPLESSKEFADALVPHLLECDISDVWTRCKHLFESKTSSIRQEMKKQHSHIWLREELLENERRTPLTPQDAKMLVDCGYKVTVERSARRVFGDEEYAQVGCTLVEGGSWKDAPLTATILGLQSFPSEDQFPLRHQHICFSYAYKQQSGWKELLSRFVDGNGKLLDIEYLVDNQNKRCATFTRTAGYIAMATGILIWCHQQLNPTTPRIKRTRSKDNVSSLAPEIDPEVPLLEYIQSQLEKAIKVAGQAPVPVVIGGNGRVGSGAVTFAKKLGLQPAVWGRQETAKFATEKGIAQLLEFDVLVNAIKLEGGHLPFLTHELISRKDRELSVIVDASCDVYNPNNPLPIYRSTSTFSRPTQRVIDDASNPLDLIAIQNLAALLPRESSSLFSKQLVPHLLHVADRMYPVWVRALEVFVEKTKELRSNTVVSVPVLQLPTDYPRPTGAGVTFNSSKQSAATSLHFSESVTAKLREVASKLGVAESRVVLAAFQVLCHRLSAEEDFMVGVIKSAGSGFVRLTNVRTTLDSATTFVKLLNSETSEEPQLVSFSEISPTSQVLFVDHVTIPETILRNTLGTVDLVLTYSTQLELIYRSDLFSKERADEFLFQLEYLTVQALNDPQQIINRYSLVTKTATQLPDVTVALDTTWEGPIVDHFVRNAARVPEKVAVIHGQTTLTYRELDQLSAQLANWLVKNGIKSEDGIFIYAHRNLSIVWAIMSCLRAGASVSLMDPIYPPERIINCLKVAEPKCWLSIEAAGEIPQEIQEFLPSVGCNLQLSIPLPSEAKERGFLKEHSTEFTEKIEITQDNVAVVTFTSGSTGLPKAVQGRHGPLTHFYPWMRTRFELSEKDQFSMCSGISHDPLQRDIFTPLFLGATIHVPDATDIGTPGQLARWMKQHGITVTHLTPAMGQLLSETVDDTQVTTLRVALFVGDKLTKRDVHRLRKVAPQVLAVNMYGSTETQRAVSYYPVPDAVQLENMKEILPVGQGMKDVQLMILNSEGIPCGVGELGEVYVRSPHLAKGYKGLPEQTREKFIPNPFRNEERDRAYRTGDLGRFKPDGMVEVTGRVDNQVKIRGFRIELGEINTMLSHHTSVRENVPIVREDTPGDKRIIAYVVPHAGHLLPPGHELRRFLENKLPNYMIPSAFVVLKSLPLTPNGKINTGALPAPERMPTNRLDRLEPQYSDTVSFTESSFKGLWKEMFPDMNIEDETPKVVVSPQEQKIAAIFADLLGTFDFSLNDSFFDLGGHSLMATRLIFNLKQTLDVDLPLEVLLKNPSVKAIANTIEAIKSNPAYKQQTLDLNAEVVLDSLIKAPSQNASSALDNIFLTGATGFVGAFLLREILDQTSAKVHCLVRASTGIDGHQRLKQHLKVHRVWKDSYEDRVLPVLGDLSQPLLGIPEDTFRKLAETVDSIVHNGAVVHWLLPYENSKAANVLGTIEIFRLAATAKLKPVHYVSTTSVFDAPHYGHVTSILENDPLGNFPESGGYGQSKWVAERVCFLARERGLPISIYRPGYISGDQTNGIWTTDDFLCRVIKGCIQLGAFPDLPNAKLDISSVDFVTKSIVALLQNKDSFNKNYHLVSKENFPFNRFFEFSSLFGYNVEKVPYNVWRQKLIDSHNGGENALHPVISLFNEEYENKWRNPKYDRSNIEKALEGTNVRPEPIDHALLGIYFSYLVRSGFLPVPAKESELFKKYVTSQEGAVELITRTNRNK